MNPKMRSKKFLNSLQCDLAVWDWKDQLPIDAIQELVLEGYVHMKLAYTGGDHYALVFTKEHISLDEADYLYNHETEKYMEREQENG